MADGVNHPNAMTIEEEGHFAAARAINAALKKEHTQFHWNGQDFSFAPDTSLKDIMLTLAETQQPNVSLSDTQKETLQTLAHALPDAAKDLTQHALLVDWATQLCEAAEALTKENIPFQAICDTIKDAMPTATLKQWYDAYAASAAARGDDPDKLPALQQAAAGIAAKLYEGTQNPGAVNFFADILVYNLPHYQEEQAKKQQTEQVADDQPLPMLDEATMDALLAPILSEKQNGQHPDLTHLLAIREAARAKGNPAQGGIQQIAEEMVQHYIDNGEYTNIDESIRRAMVGHIYSHLETMLAPPAQGETPDTTVNAPSTQHVVDAAREKLIAAAEEEKGKGGWGRIF